MQQPSAFSTFETSLSQEVRSTITARSVVVLHTATEPSVEEGETVAVLLTESDWGWATKQSCQSGRVPLEYLGRSQGVTNCLLYL